MKGVRKWFIGFLTLLGLCVPSLLTCSDTNALKYYYNSFPLISNYILNCTTDNCSSYESHNSSVFSITYDSDSRMSGLEDVITDIDKSFYIENGFPDGTKYPIWSLNFVSDRNQFSFHAPNFFRQVILNSKSLPNSSNFGGTNGHFTNPSLYSYDSIFSASYNLSTGDTTKLVDLDMLLFDRSIGKNSYSIKKLSIPLSLSKDTVVPSGTLLEWDFGLVTQDPNNFPYFDPNTRYNFDISFYSLNPDTNSFSDFHSSYRSNYVSSSSPYYLNTSATCTIDPNYRFTVVSEDESTEQFMGVNFHCSYTAPSDMYYTNFLLDIFGSSGPDYNSSSFLTYDWAGIYFTGTYLITEGDDTWSGLRANDAPDGSHISFAPGYIQLYGNPDLNQSCADGDFLCQLSNLFTFTVINPFLPIFNMFSNSSSCAQIPTIASMIHSNETQVCPFFSSSVRSITTPVLSLVSMMLVFGFTVHWLGARSGNLFEDSIDTDNYSFSNKFRRKK